MTRLLLLPLLALLSVACEPNPPTTKDIQAARAFQAAQTINFDENAEIENIKARLELTSNPGALGFVLLMNDMGQPILYAAVKGKITSSGKRLTSPFDCRVGDTSAGCYNGMAPSDEGTFGSSDPYIYFWTVSGQYYQWNGSYLYSDKPFRISVEPLVIDITEHPEADEATPEKPQAKKKDP
jgi:hypothetical protein